MSYRDDLAAAQARADAAMRSLEAEREAREDDFAHIAQLERSLAESLRELAELRERSPAETDDWKDELPEFEHRRARIPHVTSSTSSSSSGGAGVVALGVIAIGITMFVLIVLVGGSDDAPPSEDVYATTRVEQEVQLESEPIKPAITEFDITAGIADATEMARDYFGEDVLGPPFLVGVKGTGVDESGKSQLQYGEVRYHFVVNRPAMPAAPVPESSAPLGARPATKVEADIRTCYVEIRVDQNGMNIQLDHFADPGMQIPGMEDMHQHNQELSAMMVRLEGFCRLVKIDPQCSLAQVRAQSLQLGAPSDALARVSMGSESKAQCDSRICANDPRTPCCLQRGTQWQLEIVDRGETLFDQPVPDDCR